MRLCVTLQAATCTFVTWTLPLKPSILQVIILYIPMISDSEKSRSYLKALAPPLVTLMSGQPEIQYVALRNMQLLCQKYPDHLKGDVKVCLLVACSLLPCERGVNLKPAPVAQVFFVKYNDPIYVKMEKLDVLVMLSHSGNVDQVQGPFHCSLKPEP